MTSQQLRALAEKHRTVQLDWDEAQHPRDDSGKFAPSDVAPTPRAGVRDRNPYSAEYQAIGKPGFTPKSYKHGERVVVTGGDHRVQAQHGSPTTVVIKPGTTGRYVRDAGNGWHVVDTGHYQSVMVREDQLKPDPAAGAAAAIGQLMRPESRELPPKYAKKPDREGYVGEMLAPGRSRHHLGGNSEGGHKGWATRRDGDGGMADAASSHAETTSQRARLADVTVGANKKAAHLKARAAHRAAAIAHAKSGNKAKSAAHRQQAEAHWGRAKAYALEGTSERATTGRDARHGYGGDHAAHRDSRHLDGTSEGAAKGWETRRAHGAEKESARRERSYLRYANAGLKQMERQLQNAFRVFAHSRATGRMLRERAARHRAQAA